jgi:hypothetical protein
MMDDEPSPRPDGETGIDTQAVRRAVLAGLRPRVTRNTYEQRKPIRAAKGSPAEPED